MLVEVWLLAVVVAAEPLAAVLEAAAPVWDEEAVPVEAGEPVRWDRRSPRAVPKAWFSGVELLGAVEPDAGFAGAGVPVVEDDDPFEAVAVVPVVPVWAGVVGVDGVDDPVEAVSVPVELEGVDVWLDVPPAVLPVVDPELFVPPVVVAEFTALPLKSS